MLANIENCRGLLSSIICLDSTKRSGGKTVQVVEQLASGHKDWDKELFLSSLSYLCFLNSVFYSFVITFHHVQLRKCSSAQWSVLADTASSYRPQKTHKCQNQNQKSFNVPQMGKFVCHSSVRISYTKYPLIIVMSIEAGLKKLRKHNLQFD